MARHVHNVDVVSLLLKLSFSLDVTNNICDINLVFLGYLLRCDRGRSPDAFSPLNDLFVANLSTDGKETYSNDHYDSNYNSWHSVIGGTFKGRLWDIITLFPLFVCLSLGNNHWSIALCSYDTIRDQRLLIICSIEYWCTKVYLSCDEQLYLLCFERFHLSHHFLH